MFVPLYPRDLGHGGHVGYVKHQRHGGHRGQSVNWKMLKFMDICDLHFINKISGIFNFTCQRMIKH